MRTPPTRRDFLKTTAVATVAIFLPKSDPSQSDPGSPNLTAHLIWSAQSLPTPLLVNGPASDIASSSNGIPLPATPDLHSIFLKEFSLATLPAAAQIHLFAYTRYRLYVNGTCIGRGPSRYQNQRPEYDTRNLLPHLRPGSNRIVILVHRDAPTGRIMHHDPALAALIELTTQAGIQSIPTDNTWLSQPDPSFGPRDQAWASIEEHIDLRKAPDFHNPALAPGWSPSIPVTGPDFFPIHPRTTPLQLESSFPLSRDPAFPIPLIQNKPSVFSISQIIQGYHLLEFEAAPNSEIELRFLLPEDQSSGRSTCIARAGSQMWIGGDTFALNQLSIELKSGTATLTRVEIVQVRYPFECLAAFQSSQPGLDQLFTVCTRSLQLFSEDAYIDCADRERVEWTDDTPPAFDLTRVTMRGPADGQQEHYADSRLLKALLRRIALTQQPDGQLKAHSCSERFDIHAIMEDRSCDWVIQLRAYVESSGDAALAAELWPTLTRLMNWFLTRRTARGLVQAREWEVWDNPLRYQVCEGTGLNAFVYRALIDAAWLADVLRKPAESAAYSASAASLNAAIQTHLWNPGLGAYDAALFGPTSKRAEQLNGKLFAGPITGSWTDGRYQPTAQAALFALYAGLVPAHRRATLQTWLLAHRHQVTGAMSHYYLFHALYNLEDPLYDRLVLDIMRKAWQPQIDSQWQTTWEDLGDSGGSKAHIYGLVPGSFLITHVLGVRRLGPVADRTILIEPRPGNLTHAGGTAVTEFGPVQIAWEIRPTGSHIAPQPDHLQIQLTTPANTNPILRLYQSPSPASNSESNPTANPDTILIDNHPHVAQQKGPFLELPLTPGAHTIQYPL